MLQNGNLVKICSCILIQATLVRFSIVIEKPLVLWANQSVLPELSMHLKYVWVDPAVLGTLSLAPVVSKGTRAPHRACCAPGIPAQVKHPFDQNNLTQLHRITLGLNVSMIDGQVLHQCSQSFCFFFLLSTDAIWMGAHWGKDNILQQSCLQGL